MSVKESGGDLFSGRRICDFGCAAGEFPYYLKKTFPNATIEGYELLQSLIVKARINVQQVNFFHGSILDKACCPKAHADVSLAIGVLSIFDEFEPIIENLLHWTKPGGKIFLHGLFNPSPVDVYLKYAHSNDHGCGVVESGWNIFSIASVTKFLDSILNIRTFEFHPFSISIDLPKHADDCVRSWTIDTASNERLITNGLCIVQPHAILEICLK